MSLSEISKMKMRLFVKNLRVARGYSTSSKPPAVVPQSANRPGTWSKSQAAKATAMSGPRYACKEIHD